jgi:hypothetical protein
VIKTTNEPEAQTRKFRYGKLFCGQWLLSNWPFKEYINLIELLTFWLEFLLLLRPFEVSIFLFLCSLFKE